MLCGASPGSQQLEQFKKATLSFTGDCSEFAAQQLEWLRLAQEQTPEEQAICNILLQMLPTVARLHNDQQQHLCNTALEKTSDNFWKGVRPHLEILENFMETMNTIDSTI